MPTAQHMYQPRQSHRQYHAGECLYVPLQVQDHSFVPQEEGHSAFHDFYRDACRIGSNCVHGIESLSHEVREYRHVAIRTRLVLRVYERVLHRSLDKFCITWVVIR